MQNYWCSLKKNITNRGLGNNQFSENTEAVAGDKNLIKNYNPLSIFDAFLEITDDYFSEIY